MVQTQAAKKRRTFAPSFANINNKSGGFAVAELLTSGFMVSESKAAGVTTSEFKTAGVPARELRNVGLNAAELVVCFAIHEIVAANWSSKEKGFSLVNRLSLAFRTKSRSWRYDGGRLCTTDGTQPSSVP